MIGERLLFHLIFRKKRGLVYTPGKFALKTLLENLGAVGINICTDLVKGAHQYFDPNSSTNRLTNLERSYDQTIKRVSMHTEIIETLTKHSDELRDAIELTELRLTTYLENSKVAALLRHEIEAALNKATTAAGRLPIKRQKEK